jgi:ADP-heptose:LPS heptosyltransferase
VSDRVLVIKHGALGDFVLATGPFAAIRAHHPGARITLLTTGPFAALAEASPYFDTVWLDDRPGWTRPLALWRLTRRLNAGRFTHVYDLQTSDRSSLYFRLLRGAKPLWSGIARGASHPHANPRRDFMHTVDRQREQLNMAGIADVPAPDLSWLGGDVTGLRPAGVHALLVPGGSAHRPQKRWPADRFAALGRALAARGITPVLLGGGAEAALLAELAAALPRAVNLGGRTSFGQIAELARGAAFAIGNDTGPMHIIAAAAAPSIILFSHDSDPALCAPRGRVHVLRTPSLADLPVADVLAAIDRIDPIGGRS